MEKHHPERSGHSHVCSPQKDDDIQEQVEVDVIAEPADRLEQPKVMWVNEDTNETEEAESEEAKEPKKVKKNLNIEAAHLHILGDLLNSVGVIIAGAIILIWPSAWWVDPLCTYFFTLIVLYTTIKTFGRCIAIFLEASPEDIEYNEVKCELYKIEGIDLVHDLHIWAISQDKYALTVHLTLAETHEF